MVKYIDYIDFKKIQAQDSYYAKRWSYYQDVIYLLKKTGLKFANAIDLGPYKLSVVKNSHTIDTKNWGNTTYVFDANNIENWKQIPTKRYDLFIGMQVFEHLTNQNDVWEEVQRISNNALISLPYKWNCPGNCHHGIDEKLIRTWTGITPDYTIISGGDLQTSAKRIVCFYNFKDK